MKATIAKVAALEGKTAHALMVDTLQSAMEDALARQQFYADGEASFQDTLRSNTVYGGADVKADILIFEALEILVQHPEMGRKVSFGHRELVISRERTGYLALYRFLPHIKRILVWALRHQRESGYRSC